MPPAWKITLSKSATNHLSTIDRKHHRAIRDAIIEQLAFEPFVETRNRKPLDPPIFGASWELRCGINNRFRVLYEPFEETVLITAIGEKRGEQLWIGEEEVNE
jgi:mRNA-degrading endonuclease RelE of RelBE toxin-antitoxin system